MEYAGTFWAISGGEMWKKKEKWFTYGVTWGHKKTQFVFAMGNTANQAEMNQKL